MKKAFFATTIFSLLGVATSGFCAVTLPSISTTDVETYAGGILAALVVLWGIRKLKSLTNRS